MNCNDTLGDARLRIKRDIEVDVVCNRCGRKLGHGMWYQAMQDVPMFITCRECWPRPESVRP